METTKHRSNCRKGLIRATIAVIVASLAVRATTIEAEAAHVFETYVSYTNVVETSIIDISWTEYQDLLRMVMSESGYCSYEMNNGCAATAINRCIQNECSMEDTLYEPGVFGDGTFSFCAPDGEWRPVTLADVNETVVEAVNDALNGYDTTEGAIGFFAPNYCSQETIDYFYSHIDGTVQIENVVFFQEWN